MKRNKTIISILLAIVLCLSLLPASAMATFATWATDTTAQGDDASASMEATPTTVPAPEPSLKPSLEPSLESPPAASPISGEEFAWAPLASPSEYTTATTVPQTEYATPTTVPLTDVQPELIKVVSEPLVRVDYHYYDEAQNQSITEFSDYAVVSSHSYYAIAMTRGNNIAITANKYPGVVSVSTDALRFRVLLNDSEDITSVSSYEERFSCRTSIWATRSPSFGIAPRPRSWICPSK